MIGNPGKRIFEQKGAKGAKSFAHSPEKRSAALEQLGTELSQGRFRMVLRWVLAERKLGYGWLWHPCRDACAKREIPRGVIASRLRGTPFDPRPQEICDNFRRKSPRLDCPSLLS